MPTERCSTLLSEFTQKRTHIVCPSFNGIRDQAKKLCALLEARPQFMVAIFGLRQTGKAIIVRQALERTKMPGRLLPLDSLEQHPLWHPPDAGRSPTPLSPPGSTEWHVRHWRAARAEAEHIGRGPLMCFSAARIEIQRIRQRTMPDERVRVVQRDNSPHGRILRNDPHGSRKRAGSSTNGGTGWPCSRAMCSATAAKRASQRVSVNSGASSSTAACATREH